MSFLIFEFREVNGVALNRLASRHQALIELGMINRPSDVPTFARDLWVFLFTPSFMQC